MSKKLRPFTFHLLQLVAHVLCSNFVVNYVQNSDAQWLLFLLIQYLMTQSLGNRIYSGWVWLLASFQAQTIIAYLPVDLCAYALCNIEHTQN